MLANIASYIILSFCITALIVSYFIDDEEPPLA